MGRDKRPKYTKSATAPGGKGCTIIDPNFVVLLPKKSARAQALELAGHRCLVTEERKARVSLAPVPSLKRPLS